jgi:hypothetical protein
MWDNKATKDDDDAHGDVLRLLGENGLRLMTNWSTTYMKMERGPRISVKLQWSPLRSQKLQNAATNAKSASLHI